MRENVSGRRDEQHLSVPVSLVTLAVRIVAGRAAIFEHVMPPSVQVHEDEAANAAVSASTTRHLSHATHWTQEAGSGSGSGRGAGAGAGAGSGSGAGVGSVLGRDCVPRATDGARTSGARKSATSSASVPSGDSDPSLCDASASDSSEKTAPSARLHSLP